MGMFMSDEKNPAIDDLIATSQHMLDFSNQVREFYNQAITFIDRSHDSTDVYSLIVAEDGYDLRVADFPSYLFDYWYSPQENNAFRSVEDLIVKTMADSLGLKNSATVFLGKDTVSGQELYAAWKMFPEVRDNMYLVIMQSVKSNNMFSWFLEGDLKKYSDVVNPDRIGFGRMEIADISLKVYGTFYKSRTQSLGL